MGSDDRPVADYVLRPGRIGPLDVPNRIIRAGTSESAAGPDGHVSEGYVGIHRALAEGGLGAAITGHLYVADRGRYGPRQTGIHRDEQIPGLQQVTTAVHERGGRIIAQLAHAGSQSLVAQSPLAPSAVDNVLTGRRVEQATEEEIGETIDAFAAAARRAVEAGFDGVHIHGANGYLISEFRSSITNRRTDGWGGSQESRDRFPLAVIEAVRAEVPSSMSLTMKVGTRDLVEISGGLEVDDAIGGVERFVGAGLDGVEVSSNLMSDYVSGSIRPYVAVGRRRAFEDLLVHRLHKAPEPEAYFLELARALRRRVETTVILVGGIRRLATMESILASGDADFLALARPLIRQPDLVRRIRAGKVTVPDCVSCNICLMHDDHHLLQCWRTPRTRLVRHAIYRLSGGFRATGSGRKPKVLR